VCVCVCVYECACPLAARGIQRSSRLSLIHAHTRTHAQTHTHTRTHTYTHKLTEAITLRVALGLRACPSLSLSLSMRYSRRFPRLILATTHTNAQSKGLVPPPFATPPLLLFCPALATIRPHPSRPVCFFARLERQDTWERARGSRELGRVATLERRSRAWCVWCERRCHEQCV